MTRCLPGPHASSPSVRRACDSVIGARLRLPIQKAGSGIVKFQEWLPACSLRPTVLHCFDALATAMNATSGPCLHGIDGRSRRLSVWLDIQTCLMRILDRAPSQPRGLQSSAPRTSACHRRFTRSKRRSSQATPRALLGRSIQSHSPTASPCAPERSLLGTKFKVYPRRVHLRRGPRSSLEISWASPPLVVPRGLV